MDLPAPLPMPKSTNRVTLAYSCMRKRPLPPPLGMVKPQNLDSSLNIGLARIIHELLWRGREDGRAAGKPQGVGPEAYVNGTSQGTTPEDARKDGHIRGRSK